MLCDLELPHSMASIRQVLQERISAKILKTLKKDQPFYKNDLILTVFFFFQTTVASKGHIRFSDEKKIVF